MKITVIEFLLFMLSNIAFTIIFVLSLWHLEYKYGISKYLYILHLGHRAVIDIGIVLGSTIGNIVMILIVVRAKHGKLQISKLELLYPMCISMIIFGIFMNPWLFYKLAYGVYFINIPLHILISITFLTYYRLAICRKSISR